MFLDNIKKFLSSLALKVFLFRCLTKALLHCPIFSAAATCLAMLENVALQVGEVGCYTRSRQLAVFLALFSYPELLRRNEKREVCALALAVKLREKLLEGWCTVQWCCQLLQSVAKSIAEFYFVQCFAQQQNKIARQPMLPVTLCNSPVTCLATAMRDKLLRKLCSVAGLCA